MTLPLGAGAARVLALAASAGVLVVTTMPGAEAAAPRTIHYKHFHVVHNKATAQRFLTHTSDGFKAFAAKTGHAQRVEAKKSGASKECVARSGVIVQAYTRGYAYGDVGDCGGYEALWTNRTKGGTGVTGWREVFGTQDIWPCPVLRKFAVPSTVAGTKCLRPKDEKVVSYHQAWVAPSD